MTQMTVQQAFDLATQHHSAGRLPDAESLYRQILAAQPNNPDALQCWGSWRRRWASTTSGWI